jgi:hypothetical protein
VRLDNRRENLRITTHSENSRNHGKHVSYAYKNGNKFASEVSFKCKKHYVGIFDTAQEARNAALKLLETLRNPKSHELL